MRMINGSNTRVFLFFMFFLSRNMRDVCMSFQCGILWIRQILRVEIKKKAFNDGKYYIFFVTLHL